METEQLLTLTKGFISEFYNTGSIVKILPLTKESVVGYSCYMQKYVFGREAMAEFLKKVYSFVAPCKIVDIHFYQEPPDDKNCTIRTEVVLYLEKGHSLKYYNVLVMYDISQPSMPISGMHISETAGCVNMYHSYLNEFADSTKVPAYDKSLADECVAHAHIVYSVGPRSSIQYCNDKFCDILGYENADELISLDKLIYVDDLPAVRRDQLRQLEESNVYQLKYKLKNRTGTFVSVIESGNCVSKNEDEFIFSSVIIDITPLKKINDYFLSALFYDDLTGIYNKETFYKKTCALINENEEIQFEIMCVDVERFKVINEIFGNTIGNRLLQQVADFFKRATIPFCVYGRLYADKFILCYPDQNNNREYFIDALKAIASNFKKNYEVILCFGIYPIENRNIPVSAMCDKAILALKGAKGHYFVAYCEYDETMHQNLITEQTVINDMNNALKNKEFTFYLQPRYDLGTGKIDGAEALVRWQHPTKGLIVPDKFIPVFEQNGFILKLDQYICEEVCKLLASWQAEGKALQPISVNISRLNFNSDEIVSFLVELVKKYNIPPQFLELEITESAYFGNIEQIIDITKKLQESGFLILMDDFGSGYSSFNMLKDIHVDILKVDLEFLKNTDQSNRSGQILSSIVRMARGIKLPLIIEGVETLQQAEFLRSIGCNWVQGYYYSRPVTVKKYEELTAKTKYMACMVPSDNNPQPASVEDFFNPNTKFNLLFNSITCGIGIYEFADDNLHLLRANDTYFQMFNHMPESLYADKTCILDYVHKDDRAEFLRAIYKTCSENEVTQCYIRRYTADDRLMELSVNISLIVKEEEYNLIYIALEETVQDDNDYENAQMFFSNMPAAFGIFELCGTDLWVRQLSRQLYKLSGYTPKTFTALTGGNIKKLLDEKIMGITRKAILRSYEKDCAVTFEHPFTTRTGENICMTVTFNVIKSKADGLLCYAFMEKSSASYQSLEDLYKTELKPLAEMVIKDGV